ncbi:flagellar biosynthesis protein FlhB [Cellvibrio japonicus]|uniref:Flagellar biosynthetic protein FlhB n=1 Tax=Cellvibrio japonicus (strain Ueda107) TaxID=498211 RepID=B3PF03_CELJU|nr:flagellar biosynthesis protein FlhB [Cellvibrio japonicus]ACE84688.1 flagellar biosynthetic protein FlhB [Cellvibrio japonicus Ueda107]QEI12247.1 flagellar biosynthesis protein FlhB [Cellvibrio japonicus]QEI15821.1 flagellar biosynthesis protein FlhB [Cellvibrio japonicus]QEI19399.1 flagellar biosynthesis protein FlhB [Cellvibrio japonicus]
MAEGDDSSQEKTEEPSARRLEKAREEGQIPRSRDLTTTAVLLLAAIGLWVFAEFMGGKLLGITRENFIISRTDIFDTNAMISHLVRAIYQGMLSMAPLMVLLLIASIVGPIALGGWLMSSKAMMPKLSRMDPIAGLKRIFSLKSLIELFKALLKVSIILLTTIWLLFLYAQDMFRISDEAVGNAIVHSLEISIYATIALAATTIVIAAVDIPLQLYEHNKKLKMSRQDLKDEAKDTDGKPEVKGRIRQLQREMAQRRMMANVPMADVVITNPTHFAVALKYDPETMDTPIMLAKGGDNIALKIREIAKAHNIETIESPPLARAIYYTTEIDQAIPSGLYLAVAQVLAYVFQLRNYRKGKGQKPQYPRNITLPKDMQFDE